MTDEVFIKTILQKGKEAKDKVRLEFAGISLAQLNWKSFPGSWSIAQCLEHLLLSHSAYFPDLKKITEGTFKMNFWERYSPFTGLFGRMFKAHLQEQVKKKMKAPGKIQPTNSEIPLDVIETYQESMDIFLAYISNCRNVDIDKTIITSPLMRIITYNLRDTFTFLLQHEQRHLNQAMRVKANDSFPGK